MAGEQDTPHQETEQQNTMLTAQVKPSELTSITTVLKSYADFLQHVPTLPAGGHVVMCYLDTLRLRCTKQWHQLSPRQRTDDEALALEVAAHEMIVLRAAVDIYKRLMRVKTAYQGRHASQTLQRCTDVLERFMKGSQRGFGA
jgi:hypothetical protein